MAPPKTSSLASESWVRKENLEDEVPRASHVSGALLKKCGYYTQQGISVERTSAIIYRKDGRKVSPCLPAPIHWSRLPSALLEKNVKVKSKLSRKEPVIDY